MKKFLKLGNVLMCCAAVLGLVAAIVCLCAPAISYTVELLGKSSTTTYTGAQVTFGYTATTETVLGNLSGEILKFSFGNLVPYLLVLVGIVFSVLALLGKLGKISALVAAASFLIAGILFFCAVPFTVPASDKVTMDGWALGAGAIVAGILCIVSAVGAVIRALFIKK